MSYVDTLFVNGYDVRADLTGVTIVGTIDHWATGARRGDDETVPGRDGVLTTQLPRASFIIALTMQVTGASRGERNDNLRVAIASMRGTNYGIVALKRRIATGTGSSYLEHTARGRVIDPIVTVVSDLVARVVWQIENLDGAWKDSSGTFHAP